MSVDASSYFRRLSERRFRPTVHAGGAWQPGELHMAPVSGLLVHALEGYLAARGPDSLLLGRLTFEILGVIPAADLDVGVEVIRPGRTIELLEAVLTAGTRPVVRLRAWRLARLDSSPVAGGTADPLPPPDEVAVWSGHDVWGGGFIESLEVRPLPGAKPGRVRCWLRTPVPLVEGEPAGDLARFVGLVDTANGIAGRQPPTRWMYPNVDLSVYLHRQPRGSWVGLDSTAVFGAEGTGLTSTVLHDRTGPVGRAEQLLTVRPLPPRESVTGPT